MEHILAKYSRDLMLTFYTLLHRISFQGWNFQIGKLTLIF